LALIGFDLFSRHLPHLQLFVCPSDSEVNLKMNGEWMQLSEPWRNKMGLWRVNSCATWFRWLLRVADPRSVSVGNCGGAEKLDGDEKNSKFFLRATRR